MEKIDFEWYRGDDETETLVFESDGRPVDFADCDFAMDIVPERGETIHLRLSDGITVSENRVQITVSHDKTAGVSWRQASYDLQMTDIMGRVKTLCYGRIRLTHDITRNTQGIDTMETEQRVKIDASVLQKPAITVRLESRSVPFVLPDGTVPPLSDLIFNYNLGAT